jgi:hypothetical protein
LLGGDFVAIIGKAQVAIPVGIAIELGGPWRSEQEKKGWKSFQQTFSYVLPR